VSRYTVEVLPEAESEIREAFLWYFERSPLAADAFRRQFSMPSKAWPLTRTCGRDAHVDIGELVANAVDGRAEQRRTQRVRRERSMRISDAPGVSNLRESGKRSLRLGLRPATHQRRLRSSKADSA
jgi:plasmid stabilization system protein ParE